MILVKLHNNELVNISNFDMIKIEKETKDEIKIVIWKRGFISFFDKKMLTLNFTYDEAKDKKQFNKVFEYFLFLLYREIDFCDNHTGMVDIKDLLEKTEAYIKNNKEGN